AWRQSVCAITRRTSKDSAGTDTQPRCAAQNSQHERYSVGWTGTKRHHDSANLSDLLKTFSRGKNFSAAGSFPFAFFTTSGDQGSLASQSESCLASGRRG